MAESHPNAYAWNPVDSRSLGPCALRHACIELIDQLPKCGIEPVARLLQVDLDFAGNPARAPGRRLDLTAVMF